ncbi:GAF domain-containing protein [filamentous cyanobacterium LEGE 11480]|uniref:histidine kinase n=1 Tax=Romeriopsis navalis LEGE 11480 TaxID=2777977 RepID=A0A928VLZ4_9CYAN|nr:ATP-binding protein [Romeriopsis navalis]MBE9028960.1 GAF domain-containing protein [Romeriopsis navalis LEGE 11480]
MVGLNLTTADAQISRLKQPAIHSLTEVQSHGVLLVLQEPDLQILQVSSNTRAYFGLTPQEVLDLGVERLFDSFQLSQFREGLAQDNLELLNPTKMWVRKSGDDYSVFDAIVHRTSDGFLVMELELAVTSENIPFLSFYHLAQASIGQLQTSANLRDFCQIIVGEVRKVTGFDRVMLYKFDEDGHGEVVAEEKIEALEPYLGLHYPESDIPQTARQMFLSNWIRVIPDTSAKSAPLFPRENPQTGQPVDLIQSILRSAYPCHIEYLHNMGVGASLTISLMKDDKLWGLIACHHGTAKYVPYEVRKACEFLGRVVFSEIATREEEADYHYRMKLAQVQSSLFERMAQSSDFIHALTQDRPNLLDLAAASGAAICFNGHWTTIGRTPADRELDYLAQWLSKNVQEDVFYTDSLPLLYSDAERFKDVASGLLAIPISKRSYVLWFRPEVLQTVNWGGDPHHAYELDESGQAPRLCPRKSFDAWKETVQLQSLPWQSVEVKAVLELRKAIVNIVLRQAEELAILAQDLARSNGELKKFAYVASHDLQEPLNQVANYVQLLEMRYNDALDADAKDFIDFAVEGVSLMQTLIDDVLVYSKVDLQGVEWQLTPVDEPLQRALGNLRGRIAETETEIVADTMPTIVADSTQLMQLFQNLIGNAMKFRHPDRTPQIHIGVERLEEDWQFSVKDNGIGIDPQFADRIFVIFQRLHTRDEYPGSGMGLAICKKIVECHRGRIWLESESEEGVTFKFTIPLGGRDRDGNGRQNYLLS